MIIIKLGGSVIQKEVSQINPQFFEFINLIKSSNEKVLITNGGGPFCRVLQNSLKENGVGDNRSLGIIGFNTDNLFGEFILLNLPQEKVFPQVITSQQSLDAAKAQKENYQFFIGGAWDIGHSSDYNAVTMAIEFGSNDILRITNVDFVYDRDPNKFPDAQKIPKMDWEQYMYVIGNKEFVPGGNYPFDPVASALAKDSRKKVYLTSLEKILERKTLSLENFVGSIIG